MYRKERLNVGRCVGTQPVWRQEETFQKQSPDTRTNGRMAHSACITVTVCNSAKGEAPAKWDRGCAGVRHVTPHFSRCLKSFQRRRALQQGSHP